MLVPTRELGVQIVMLVYKLFGGSVNAGVPGEASNMFAFTGPRGLKARCCVVHSLCGALAVWCNRHVVQSLCGAIAVWRNRRVVQYCCPPPNSTSPTHRFGAWCSRRRWSAQCTGTT